MNKLLGDKTKVMASLMEEYSMSEEDAYFYAELVNKTYTTEKESGSSTWYCDGYCVDCPPVDGYVIDSWYIGRAQPVERKLAKVFVFLGGVVLVALTYGAAAWVGAMVIGAAAYFHVAAVVSLAGGAIGLGHLLTAVNDRACPNVSFKELPEKNREKWKGLGNVARQVWAKIRGTDADEREFTLLDVFQDELLSRWEYDEQSHVTFERNRIPPKHRLAMVMACNMLTLNSKQWVDNTGAAAADMRRTERPIAAAAMEKRENSIVYKCAEWLCNVKEPKSSIEFFKMGVFSKCGGRTQIKKGLGLG